MRTLLLTFVFLTEVASAATTDHPRLSLIDDGVVPAHCANAELASHPQLAMPGVRSMEKLSQAKVVKALPTTQAAAPAPQVAAIRYLVRDVLVARHAPISEHTARGPPSLV